MAARQFHTICLAHTPMYFRSLLTLWNINTSDTITLPPIVTCTGVCTRGFIFAPSIHITWLVHYTFIYILALTVIITVISFVTYTVIKLVIKRWSRGIIDTTSMFATHNSIRTCDCAFVNILTCYVWIARQASRALAIKRWSRSWSIFCADSSISTGLIRTLIVINTCEPIATVAFETTAAIPRCLLNTLSVSITIIQSIIITFGNIITYESISRVSRRASTVISQVTSRHRCKIGACCNRGTFICTINTFIDI